MTGNDDSLGPDDERTVHGVYDWSTTSVSQAVIETVAAATDRDETGIPPLYDYIDPDHLDALVGGEEASEEAVAVSFTMEGHEVDVYGDGRVIVHLDGAPG